MKKCTGAFLLSEATRQASRPASLTMLIPSFGRSSKYFLSSSNFSFCNFFFSRCSSHHVHEAASTNAICIETQKRVRS